LPSSRLTEGMRAHTWCASALRDGGRSECPRFIAGAPNRSGLGALHKLTFGIAALLRLSRRGCCCGTLDELALGIAACSGVSREGQGESGNGRERTGYLTRLGNAGGAGLDVVTMSPVLTNAQSPCRTPATTPWPSIPLPVIYQE